MKHKELFNLLDNIQEDQEISIPKRHDRGFWQEYE